MDEIVREEASDGASGQQLLAAFVAEIAVLYPGWTPTTGPSADPADFEPHEEGSSSCTAVGSRWRAGV